MWEYKVVYFNYIEDHLNPFLNKEGALGWELISVRDEGSNQMVRKDLLQLIFKRQKD
jgi:hypothetical protein